MENLVRRFRRVFNPGLKKEPTPSEPAECLTERMVRLGNTLPRWMEERGWRLPRRTISEAAADLQTDTVTLHHYFRQHMHQDFRTWRNQLRLEDACRMLLEDPDIPASEIGKRAGFSNRSNFTRQFVDYTGLTPQQWRKAFRNITVRTSSPSRP